MTPANIPTSTYRVQFNRDFRFLDCQEIVPYLHALGIGALYSSPHFRARRGSEHGYDVASPLRVNSELGTDEEFNDLCTKLRHYNLGLILDIVPNHMAASHENPWWTDVLEHGPASPYAHYFDIDWHPVVSKSAFLQEDKVLLPILGDLYGNILDRGEFTLDIDETGFFLRYWERKLPLDPATWDPILAAWQQRIQRDVKKKREAKSTLDQVRRLVQSIPPRTHTAPADVSRRLRDAYTAQQRTFLLYRDHYEARMAIETVLHEISEDKAQLHAILQAQGYRLAFWKIAYEEINYRRFFDINDLVCLRVEEEDVFYARHQFILELLAEGKLTGLRVDHIDGLFDPETYLNRLQSSASRVSSKSPVYLIVEKILGRDEQLSTEWPTSGTTGYDFLSAVNDLLIDNSGLLDLETIYAEFTGHTETFSEVCYERNKQVIWQLFTAEAHALGHHLGRLAAQDWLARDVPMTELLDALVETTACLPIYRTYIRTTSLGDQDRNYIQNALAMARRRTTEAKIGDPAFEFLRRILLLQPSGENQPLIDQYLLFVMRWQQFSGPIMAKGLEDTAGYVHNSLISRNEVGSDPVRNHPPLDIPGFHRFLEQRARLWPHTLNSTSTHDTKRSEDVRARLHVLSEIPEDWKAALSRWRRLNQPFHSSVKGTSVPAPEEEVLLYQTLLGSWPLDPSEEEIFPARVPEFLLKAAREAKTYTAWVLPDENHEQALLHFADKILQPAAQAFRRDFLRLHRKLAWHGALNSLSQLLLKITAPGLPDFYQGCELWDFSMVDPDNRRPVDFRHRIQMLEDIRREHGNGSRRFFTELLRHWQNGRIKLFLSDRALDFRRANADLYQQGQYIPVETFGPHQKSLCAFARRLENQWAITLVPRLTTRLGTTGRWPLGEKTWLDTSVELPDDAPDQWHNILTGETVQTFTGRDGHKALALADVLKTFPCALLHATTS
ncbi:MAG: malto-oligosyltrehalose synthase [Acidobacteriaceae bacterium]